jgi:PhnB protein
MSEVIPYLRVKGAAEALAFYTKVFGATEKLRLDDPGGRIGHAEILIDGATLMLADEYPEKGMRGPLALGGTSVAMHLQVPNVDAVVKQAAVAGATVMREPADQFYGERIAMIRDPFGHEWLLSQHIETVSPEEMQRRYNALAASGAEWNQKRLHPHDDSALPVAAEPQRVPGQVADLPCRTCGTAKPSPPSAASRAPGTASPRRACSTLRRPTRFLPPPPPSAASLAPSAPRPWQSGPCRVPVPGFPG